MLKIPFFLVRFCVRSIFSVFSSDNFQNRTIIFMFFTTMCFFVCLWTLFRVKRSDDFHVCYLSVANRAKIGTLFDQVINFACECLKREKKPVKRLTYPFWIWVDFVFKNNWYKLRQNISKMSKTVNNIFVFKCVRSLNFEKLHIQTDKPSFARNRSN